MTQKSVSEAISSLAGISENRVSLQSNLIDLTRKITPGYLVSSGLISASYTGWTSIPFFRVNKGTRYTLISVKCYCLYDQYLNLLSRVERSSNNETFEIITGINDCYMQVSYINGEEASSSVIISSRDNISKFSDSAGNEVKVSPGDVDFITEETLNRGAALHVYTSAAIKGWGSAIAGNGKTVSRVSVVKHANNTITANLSVSLYESPDTELALFSQQPAATGVITPSNYAGSANIDVQLSNPVTLSPRKYYTLFVEDNCTFSDLKQTYRSGNANADAGSTFVRCFYRQNNAYLTSDYGLYWQIAVRRIDDELIQIPESIQDSISLLAGEIKNLPAGDDTLRFMRVIKQRQLAGRLSVIRQFDRDIYVVLAGDSISGSNNSSTLPIEGQTRVPAVCDRTNFPYYLWKTVGYGSAQYRRFDDRKASLLDGWNPDPAITDDSGAFFRESGVWRTFYKLGGLTNNSYSFLNTGMYRGNYTTKPDLGDNPGTGLGYCNQSNSVPRRVSAGGNDYVEFAIPAGFSKFDIILNMCANGDTINISVAGGNCTMYAGKRGQNGITANGATFDTSYAQAAFKDAGQAQRRLFFSKSSADTLTVRLAKTTLGKVLNYWGVSYWGTIFEPYALHIVNAAVSGGSIAHLNNSRKTYIEDNNADFVILENTTLNNFAGEPADDKSSVVNSYISTRNEFVNYLASLEIQYLDMVSHQRSAWQSSQNYKVFDNILSKLKANITDCIDVDYAFRLVWENYFSDLSYSQFLDKMTVGDGVHPNDLGFIIWRAAISISLGTI